MLRINTLFTILVLVALMFSACQPITRPPATEPQPPQGLRPDAPPYAVHGPYAVGARDFIIKETSGTLYVTVWYPALNPTNRPEEITYFTGADNPDFPGRPIKGRALHDAQPDMAGAPYPLVVYSGGVVGWRQMSAYLPEHLASHGFVVIAADPRDETWAAFWPGAATRPADTKRLIAYSDELNAPDGNFAGLIDTERIAVAGHSSGGWTALAGGGAQFDFSFCYTNPDYFAKATVTSCAQFAPHQADIAQLRGLASVPTSLWPPVYDERVDAIIPLSPDPDIWGADYQGLANVKVPTLLMTASEDVGLPREIVQGVYEHLGSTRKGLITFEGADHLLFLNQCKDNLWFAEVAGFAVCSDPVWDMARAHDLINHFATAFLLAELKGDKEAAKALAPENVTFPGIKYETTEFTK
ncbi:MAG: alpha/beta fold hydrolase [Caldilineaceae bacterium]